MGSIQAIETKYHGYRFRSRLEARWAVFLDTLGVPYEYEKEGFALGPRQYNPDGPWPLDRFNQQQRDFGELAYLPDFWLPDQHCWMEIKGTVPNWEEKEKAWRLAIATQRRVYIFHGDFSSMPTALIYTIHSSRYDSGHIWYGCTTCGEHNITTPHTYTDPHLMCCGAPLDSLVDCDPMLVNAWLHARRARFEHGEAGW